MDKFSEYLELIEQSGINNQVKFGFRIILDPDELSEYMAKTGSVIGIVFRGIYNTFVVDLIEDADGNRYTHERIIKNYPDNSVVIVPKYNGKYVLLKQFRYTMNDYQLAFPRGNGEPNITAEDNARKEIAEELNCDAISLRPINKIVSDSGICGDAVNVFVCEVTEPKIKPGYEGINSFCLCSYDELKQTISDGAINDGFTLAAFAMFDGDM